MATNSKRRGGHRATLTSLISKANSELEADEPSNTYLRQLKQEITYQQTTIAEFDSLIQSENQEDNVLTADIAEASAYRMKSGEVLIKIEEFLKPTEIKPNVSSQLNSDHSVKLPYIKLSTFEGNPMHWPAFWDLFKTSIHNRRDLSAPAKFHYLTSQLKGDALNLVSGFEHTEGEYLEAVALLEQTYGKPKIIIQARLHALLDLESPTSTSASLSKFRSSYEGHLRALKSLGCNLEESGYVYCTILLRKLPRSIFENINRAYLSDTWSLEELRKAIETEVNLIRANETADSDKFNLDNKLECSSASLAVVSTKPNANKTDRKLKCNFCFLEHSSTNCTKYDTYDSRQARVKELKLCYNCLLSNHSLSSCKNPRVCKVDGGRHHTSICKNFKKTSNETKTAEPQTAMTITGSNNFSGNILPTAQIVVNSEGLKLILCSTFVRKIHL